MSCRNKPVIPAKLGHLGDPAGRQSGVLPRLSSLPSSGHKERPLRNVHDPCNSRFLSHTHTYYALSLGDGGARDDQVPGLTLTFRASSESSPPHSRLFCYGCIFRVQNRAELNKQ